MSISSIQFQNPLLCLHYAIISTLIRFFFFHNFAETYLSMNHIIMFFFLLLYSLLPIALPFFSYTVIQSLTTQQITIDGSPNFKSQRVMTQRRIVCSKQGYYSPMVISDDAISKKHRIHNTISTSSQIQMQGVGVSFVPKHNHEFIYRLTISSHPCSGLYSNP